MYTTGQEVTATGIPPCKIVDTRINDSATDYVHRLSNGRCYLEKDLSLVEPRRAVIWQSTYPRNHIISNRMV